MRPAAPPPTPVLAIAAPVRKRPGAPCARRPRRRPRSLPWPRGCAKVGRHAARGRGGAGVRLLLAGRDEARLAKVAGRTGGVALGCDLAAAGGAAALARRALSSAS